MMKKLGLLALTLVLSLIGLACAKEQIAERGSGPAKVDTKPPTQTPAKAAWEVEWGKALAEAKKEGKVNIFSNAGADVRVELTKAFKEKFGLELEWVVGSGDELAQRFYSERRAGIHFADMYLHGSGLPALGLKLQGFLKPIPPLLLLPEITDPKVWWGGKPHFTDAEEQYMLDSNLYPMAPLLINTEQVTKEEVKSYKNLLEPRWKGKMVMGDPTISGSPNSWFSVVGYKLMDVDFLRQLAKQDIAVTRDARLLVEWVARGKNPVGIAAFADTAAAFQKAGAPIKLVTPLEGTYLTGGSGTIWVINQGPHPNATTTFVNWFLSKEGQTLYSKIKLTQSARVDVTTDGLPPDSVRDPSIPYFIYNSEEFIVKVKPEYTELAKQIFGPLMK